MDAGCRIGIGYDIHRLVEGRPLLLAGVRIDFPLGLQGHSDGDVVLHAVADALLGAACLPDIGEQFPDTDPAYKDADSRRLLTQVLERLAAAGYRPVQLDCIVHAERPKLVGKKRAIAASIAGLLGVESTAVSVKAKTNEGLGPVGTGEAIGCTAIAVISRS